jgi:hypothetical protein
VNLAEFRSAAAAALDGLDDSWAVHPAPLDGMQPPAFMLVWGDPWLAPATNCARYATLEVVAVAARLEPEANYPTLETMVAAANLALEAAALIPAQTARPGPLDFGGITYLAARILIRQPVTLS